MMDYFFPKSPPFLKIGKQKTKPEGSSEANKIHIEPVIDHILLKMGGKESPICK